MTTAPRPARPGGALRLRRRLSPGAPTADATAAARAAVDENAPARAHLASSRMSTRRLFPPVLLALLAASLLAMPAHAQRLVVGIGDQKSDMFSDPRFAAM